MPKDIGKADGSHLYAMLPMRYGPCELPEGTWAAERLADKSWAILRTNDYLPKGYTAIRLIDLPDGSEEITPG